MGFVEFVEFVEFVGFQRRCGGDTVEIQWRLLEIHGDWWRQVGMRWRLVEIRDWGQQRSPNYKAQMSNQAQSTNDQGLITPLAPLTLRGGFRGCHVLLLKDSQ
jgi:hypothetical protein